MTKQKKNSDEPEPRIHVESHNQKGGVTVGVVNLDGVLPAELKYSEGKYDHTADGVMQSMEITLISDYTIPNFQILAAAPTLKSTNVEAASGQILFSTRHPPLWRVANGKVNLRMSG